MEWTEINLYIRTVCVEKCELEKQRYTKEVKRKTFGTRMSINIERYIDDNIKLYGTAEKCENDLNYFR